MFGYCLLRWWVFRIYDLAGLRFDCGFGLLRFGWLVRLFLLVPFMVLVWFGLGCWVVGG